MGAGQDVAGADQAGTTRSFDLPAQPLPQALQSYGEITGVAVLIDAHLLGDKRMLKICAVVGTRRQQNNGWLL